MRRSSLTTEFLPAFLISYSNSDFTLPHEVCLPDEAPDCRVQFTHMGARYSGFETPRHRATSPAQQGFRSDHEAKYNDQHCRKGFLKLIKHALHG